MKRYGRRLLLLVPLLLLAGAVLFYPENKEAETSNRAWATFAADKPSDASAAVKALCEALKDKDADVRKNAAVSLGRIGKDAKEAVPALAEALKDTDTDVRGAAALALGRIGKDAAGATEALAALLKDKDKDVRGARRWPCRASVRTRRPLYRRCATLSKTTTNRCNSMGAVPWSLSTRTPLCTSRR